MSEEFQCPSTHDWVFCSSCTSTVFTGSGPSLLVVFARISVKKSGAIGIEENPTKLFLETEKVVAMP